MFQIAQQEIANMTVSCQCKAFIIKNSFTAENLSEKKEIYDFLAYSNANSETIALGQDVSIISLKFAD